MLRTLRSIQFFCKVKYEHYLSREGGGLSTIPPQEIFSYENRLLQKIESKVQPYKKAVQDFRNLVTTDPIIRMYFNDGILQSLPVHNSEERKNFRLLGNTVSEAMQLINAAITTAPRFEDRAITGVPIYCLFMDYLQTKQGRAFFSQYRVNNCLRDVFDEYGQFLNSPESLNTIKGWISGQALKFWEPSDYKLGPKDQNYGFKCWHDFFLRSLNPSKRPINPDEKTIANVCESYPLVKPAMPVKDIKLQDTFWLKDGCYSLRDMVGPDFSDEQISPFIGGTVYQAFLSPWTYHRWHAPADAEVLQVQKIPGLYYMQNPEVEDDEAYLNSQPFLCCTSARMVYLLKTKFGNIFIIMVGMLEVSSCISALPDPKYGKVMVKKGEEIGHFEFGGSSHCLIFDKNFNLDFTGSLGDSYFHDTIKNEPSSKRINVRSDLAKILI